MKKLVLIVTLLLASVITRQVHAASYKLVANSNVRIDSLAKKEVSDLFMKKKSKWDNGAPVVAVDQVETSSIREGFSKGVHGKTTAAVKSYWNQQIFSGRDVPPVEKRSDAEVLAFVRSTPGAIGYVSDAASAEGVRVIGVH